MGEDLILSYKKDLEKANKKVCQKYLKIIEKEIIENFSKFSLTNIKKDRKDNCPITIYGVAKSPIGISHCCDSVYFYIKEKRVYIVLVFPCDIKICELKEMVVPTKYIVEWWSKVKQIKNL